MKTRIKEYRAKQDLTQDQLAKKVDVRRETIVFLEQGKYNPSLELAHKVSKALKCKIEDIFLFEDNLMLPKFKQLSGIANNLASSIIGYRSYDYMGEFTRLKITKVNVDLLHQKIIPKKAATIPFAKLIEHYKLWLSEELDKARIPIEELENVSIELGLESKKMTIYMDAAALIEAKEKIYIGKAKGSWVLA